MQITDHRPEVCLVIVSSKHLWNISWLTSVNSVQTVVTRTVSPGWAEISQLFQINFGSGSNVKTRLMCSVGAGDSRHWWEWLMSWMHGYHSHLSREHWLLIISVGWTVIIVTSVKQVNMTSAAVSLDMKNMASTSEVSDSSDSERDDTVTQLKVRQRRQWSSDQGHQSPPGHNNNINNILLTNNRFSPVFSYFSLSIEPWREQGKDFSFCWWSWNNFSVEID